MITQKDLLAALRAVGKFHKREVVIYSREGGLLTVAAWNIGYSTDVPYDGPSLQTDLKHLTAIVRAFPPTADLTLTWAAPSLTIGCGPVAAPVDAWLSESYVIDWEEADVEVPASVFCQALTTTIPFASRNGGNFRLHTVHFVMTPDHLRAESTDGFRFIRRDFPGSYKPLDFLIGLGEAKVILSILNGNAPVNLGLRRDSDGVPFRMFVSQGRFRLAVNIPTMRYIDADARLFSQAGTATLSANRADLLLVANVAIALKERLLLVGDGEQLHFSTHPDKVHLMSIPYPAFAESGIDAVFLRDAVIRMGDEVFLHVSEKLYPIRLTSDGIDALVMPFDIHSQ